MKMSAYYKDTNDVLHRINTDASTDELEATSMYVLESVRQSAWHTGEFLASPVLMLLQGGKA